MANVHFHKEEKFNAQSDTHIEGAGIALAAALGR